LNHYEKLQMDIEETTLDSPPKPRITWESIRSSPSFVPTAILIIAFTFAFWALISILPGVWGEKDGYYSHGFIVPLITGYIIYRWWPKLKDIPVRPGWIALPFFLLSLYISWAGSVSDLRFILAISIITTILTGTWLVAGWQWMIRTALPVLYLLFAMPIWTFAIDIYTAPLQRLSTVIAYKMLYYTGFDPFMPSQTTILLNNYPMEVASACSGFKLLVAIAAFTIFFVLVGGLKWFGNLVMIALIIPLSLVINGLRVALIGVVGDRYGEVAAAKFHDWSGYITLIVCFFILFKVARLLGWKD
jgi:exosortase